MSKYGPLKDVNPNSAKGANNWFATCPNCGVRGTIDEDQLKGRVSVDCPECDYHETHDHSDQVKGTAR